MTQYHRSFFIRDLYTFLHRTINATMREARLQVWWRIKMSESGVPLEYLFTSKGQGRAFSLVPEPRSSVPFQWAHFDPGAIPNTLADTPCNALNVTELLELNDILGTGYSLDERGLMQCLAHFLCFSRDFGQVYGSLRCHWRSNFTQLLFDLAAKQREDEAMRKNALDCGYITNSWVSTRRMWDPHSNRVLPFHVLPSGGYSKIPDYVWTLSHSWVHETCARTNVWTPINGYEWPVPIPNDTTFDHVRVELLNLGAEKEEWELDVPTIGYMYARSLLCATYFNGLGLPFDPSPQVLSSDRHWLNRVWTVQEATNSWLPGGATGTVSADTRHFFQNLPRSMPLFDRLPFAAEAMQGRHCTTELDRIHGLAYILGCETLPIYDEGMPPELA
ncbi:uncharacterized protein PHACADRAFT_211413 [Phanerochaete carnosa HHB-10118-sp]|uniref:Uncharacterized protein n=1 Tax=Phanerochaete carnosa (strain HHB-10118-sp) TaxID=650164 RepID=K5W3R4_PHACS|nr:uncharacterized protein PHACADRAFT_211413 [Phanerochaete carnosa HHB-10118-sp]EKM53765.1 hypothetical protein PHACADRAFT_211413 [Phanerochaete carnosa HHB-10118-sp]